MSRHPHPAPASPLSFRVNVARLPQKGMPVVIDANEEQREALVAIHGLLECRMLRAELTVTPWKRNGVSVSGTIEADVVQACVVTLEPVENRVAESIDQVYLPEDSKLGRQGFGAGGEILLDVEGNDGPETFSGDWIDVGALVEEFFGLGIDPYPRAPGAELPAGREIDTDAPHGALEDKLSPLVRKP